MFAPIKPVGRGSVLELTDSMSDCELYSDTDESIEL